MSSFVLDEIRKNDLTCACASCQSAMWQIYENTTDRAVGFIDGSSFMYGEKRVRLACWCTVLHKFVQSWIPLCDGNSPEEEEDGENAGGKSTVQKPESDLNGSSETETAPDLVNDGKTEAASPDPDEEARDFL